MRIHALMPLGLGLALAASAPAVAQTRHNSDAPIDVASDHAELQDRNNRALLSGNVKITQAELTLLASRVTVSYTGQIAQGTQEVVRIDAAGGVTVTRPDQTARSQYAVYDINRRTITMIGGVTLNQGVNVVRGGRLSINLDTGRATIDGSGVASGAAPGTPGVQTQGGRVTGRFSVPKRQNQPQTPPPAAPPRQ